MRALRICSASPSRIFNFYDYCFGSARVMMIRWRNITGQRRTVHRERVRDATADCDAHSIQFRNREAKRFLCLFTHPPSNRRTNEKQLNNIIIRRFESLRTAKMPFRLFRNKHRMQMKFVTRANRTAHFGHAHSRHTRLSATQQYGRANGLRGAARK